MSRPGALVIGGSSPAAAYFVDALKNDYELESFSSNKISLVKSYRYGDFNSVKNKKYDKVIIFSSGVPNTCPTFDHYNNINNSIYEILSSINIEGASLTFLSSFSVFDKNVEVIDEDTEVSPSDYYGEAKVYMEKRLEHDYGEVVKRLNILRLPVYIYKGVRNNFLGTQLRKAQNGEIIRLFNPTSKFYAVINDLSLYAVDANAPDGINHINCSSNGDLYFYDLEDILVREGAIGVEWVESNRPSTTVLQAQKYRNIFQSISTKKIISEWIESENNK